MKITLEGEEVSKYLEYLEQSRVKTIREVQPSLVLPEVVDPEPRERHAVIPTEDVTPTKPKRSYHRWTSSEDNIITYAATATTASLKGVHRVHRAIGESTVTLPALISRIHKLGYRLKEDKIYAN